MNVENTDDDIVADLRRVMSVHKDLVRTWERQDGFATEEGRVGFAAALERKFGQFAFPDAFDLAIDGFKKRVWSRHDKTGSPPGKVYRSLRQIRFHAEPDWSAAQCEITLVAIMHDPDRCEASEASIREELESEIDKVDWPSGLKWSTPRLRLGTAENLTAADVIVSRRADFDFLST